MLTAIEVRNAKPKDKPYKLTDGKGLHLHIAPSGKKTWRYRFAWRVRNRSLCLASTRKYRWT